MFVRFTVMQLWRNWIMEVDSSENITIYLLPINFIWNNLANKSKLSFCAIINHRASTVNIYWILLTLRCRISRTRVLYQQMPNNEFKRSPMSFSLRRAGAFRILQLPRCCGKKYSLWYVAFQLRPLAMPSDLILNDENIENNYQLFQHSVLY